MYKILLATDGSTNSFKAAEKAAKLAGALDAKVTVISIIKDVQISSMPEEIHEKIEENTAKILEKTKDFLKEKEVEAEVISYQGDPGNVICEVAEKDNYDLIVMGSSGLGSIEELFLGAVSNKVVHRAKTSVLIVK
ncbi:MAG: universal stress protein [Firmicutes bacterium]|nr:universal stress protein [Bacillota bacterium]